jgi:heme-degrading monooxygenase HmoA
MPTISAQDRHLTVLNLFSTDEPAKQDKLLSAMREIVDTAAFPGWISSTVHSGQDSPGTANFIQWRSGEDLNARYAGEEFRHRTLPLFQELTTAIKLLQTEVAFTQRHSDLGEVLEISPDRDDYTVIELTEVPAADQDAAVEALGAGQEWLLAVPGYRSHVVLRGLDARGLDSAFVVVYSQWADKAGYDTFQAVPDDLWSPGRRATKARVDALAIARESNTYRVVHSRSAAA